MNKIIKIPTLIGIFFLVVGVAAGIILIQSTQIFRSGASVSTSPKDVRVSNITDKSFTVTWISDKESTGFVKYGTSQNSLGTSATELTKKAGIIHTVDVNSLQPGTTYFFKINSNGTDYDSNGIPWNTNTGQTLPEPEVTLIISGSIVGENGSPAPGVLVIATVTGASPLSTITGENGSWLLNISKSRTAGLNAYSAIDVNETIVDILAQAGTNMATAKITPSAGRNTPAITLGSVNNFTGIATGGEEVPGALIDLPEEISAGESKFVLDNASASASIEETVTLASVDEGETITTQEPEFFGEGPPGVTLTITVESDPITESIDVSKSGDWQWSPPASLAPGEHKITVSWRDALGILRTLTRSFVVSASEGPAFESTPSASLSPTPTASPTATPTATATASPSATASATPTTVPIPDSGTLTPTIVLFIMGVGLILLALAIGFFAF